MKKAEVKKKVKNLVPKLINIRRYLHANPELSFNEENTSKYISTLLTDWKIQHQTNVGGLGIVGTIEGKNPQSKIIALRADMDALAIIEQNNVSYSSLNDGVMHACGHDIHMTCLLGAINILNNNKHDFEGTIKFIFQPAEENLPGGAIKMIKEGVLENPKPEMIFAQHVFPDLEIGKVGVRAGVYMASSDEINLTITGKGGHAAILGSFDDTVLAASSIVVALQQIVSRHAPPTVPSVLSFGRMIADGAYNVIPSEVTIQGTFRTFNEAWRNKVHALITNIAQNTALAHNTNCEVVINKGYPVLQNNKLATDIFTKAAIDFVGEENVIDLDIRMTVEDFARYTQLIPGCFYRLGTSNKEKGIISNLHTPTFNVDEKSIEIGTGLMIWTAISALNNQ
jgi:amidohydrolase